MAKYITLRVEDEAFEELQQLTKHREVWLGSPTGDWSPKRAFLDGSDFEPSSLGRRLDVGLGNIYFVDDEVFENIRRATEELVNSASQAGAQAMDVESDSKDLPQIKFFTLDNDQL